MSLSFRKWREMALTEYPVAWKAAAYIRPGGHQPYGQDNRTSKIHG